MTLGAVAGGTIEPVKKAVSANQLSEQDALYTKKLAAIRRRSQRYPAKRFQSITDPYAVHEANAASLLMSGSRSAKRNGCSKCAAEVERLEILHRSEQ